MDASVVLSVLASAISLVTYVFYNMKVLKGEIGPVVIAWCLWAVITSINVYSYWKMNSDLISFLAIITDWLCCVVTTVVLVFKGFRTILFSLNNWQKTAAIVSAVAASLGLREGSEISANLALQVGYITAFVPMLIGLWKNPTLEKRLPWLIWSGSYGLGVVVVCLRWRGRLEDLASPALYFVLHFAVAVLAARKPTENRSVR